MGKQNTKAWRCTVCGYIHTGDEAPDYCPVCGAAMAEFEPYTEPEAVRPVGRATRWQCLNCNYIHEGAEPPEQCPVCGAEKNRFDPAPEAEPGEQARTMRVAIVGAGIAGVSAAEAIRRVSPDSPITLIATDSEPPYYRLNLTRYLAGEITRDAFPLHPEPWYAEQNISLICGQTVDRLAPEARRIVMSDGREIPYEKLILAMGAHPYVPSLQGTHRDGVVSLRTAADADEILRRLRPGLRCVCIGGGVLGIETAGALARRGVAVSLLESHDWLMPRQLNPKGAAVLEAHIGKIGVTVVRNARTREILGEEHVTGVALEDGRCLPADLVVLAMGVRPNTALARKAGIEVNNGILVNNHLESSLLDILAAGDVAEHNGQLYGSWAASQFQGSIAGLNAVGVRTAFGGLPRSNTIKALGLDLTSIGKFQPEDGSYVALESEEPGAYLEFVFRDGRMVGAILIGHTELAAPAKKAIESGQDFSALLQAAPSCADVARRLAGG
jgi:nitrite reductase (NADH) large subunit